MKIKIENKINLLNIFKKEVMRYTDKYIQVQNIKEQVDTLEDKKVEFNDLYRKVQKNIGCSDLAMYMLIRDTWSNNSDDITKLQQLNEEIEKLERYKWIISTIYIHNYNEEYIIECAISALKIVFKQFDFHTNLVVRDNLDNNLINYFIKVFRSYNE